MASGTVTSVFVEWFIVYSRLANTRAVDKQQKAPNPLLLWDGCVGNAGRGRGYYIVFSLHILHLHVACGIFHIPLLTIFQIWLGSKICIQGVFSMIFFDPGMRVRFFFTKIIMPLSIFQLVSWFIMCKPDFCIPSVSCHINWLVSTSELRFCLDDLITISHHTCREHQDSTLMMVKTEMMTMEIIIVIWTTSMLTKVLTL